MLCQLMFELASRVNGEYSWDRNPYGSVSISVLNNNKVNRVEEDREEDEEDEEEEEDEED